MRTSELEVQKPKQEGNPAKKQSLFTGRNIFLVMLGLFVLGMMYGSILLQNGDSILVDGLSQIQEGFLEHRKNGRFLGIFWESLCSSGIFFLLSFLLGFSAVGQPVCFCLPFVRGLGLGSCISYFYLYDSYMGIGYCAVVMLPGMVLSVFALILSARESIRFSNSLLQSFWKSNSRLSQTALKLYVMKHLILLGVLILSALLDSILAVLFSQLFHLT